MIYIEKLKQVALAVKGWGNCNQAWLDTSGDTSVAVVGSIDEDGNSCQVITVDCDQYYQGQDSLPLAKYYAQANPSAVLELITRLEDLEVVNLSILTDLGNIEEKLVAQELVIQQLRDALIFLDDCDKTLTIPTSTKHLEAWYKGQVGDAVAYQEYTEDGKSYYLVYSKQATKKQTPLHAIKPFKGE